MLNVEERVHRLVLELLRDGCSVQAVAQAMAQEKVKLMQADEYLSASRENDFKP